MALLVYMDDIVLAGNNAQACKDKNYLNVYFSIKELGPLKYFSGIEVVCSPQEMFLSQRCQCKYALEILQQCGLLGARVSN